MDKYQVLLIQAEKASDPQQLYFRPAVSLLGLDLLAACADRQGYAVKVYDGEVNDAAAVIDEELTNKGVQLVGFYCHYYNMTEVIALSSYVKQQHGVPVLVGGPQTAVLDQEFLTASGADVLVRGEGEQTFLELLAHYLDGKGELAAIAGIVFRDLAGKSVITRERELIHDLDSLPIPKADNRLENIKRKTFVNIMTGRGCPFACAFCYEGHNTAGVRYRSVPNVLAEVETHLATSNKPQEFLAFSDDTFTLDYQRVTALCQGLKRLRKKYDFMWFCEGHVRTIYRHPEIIPLMVEAGLGRIQIGVESGVQDILDTYNKQVTLAEIKEVVRLCAAHRVPQVYCNIIIGGAFETRETIAQSTKFAIELLELGKGMLAIGLPVYMPLPNTAMTRHPEEYGIELLDPASEFSRGVDDYPVVATAALTREDIQKIKQEFFTTLVQTMRRLTDEVDVEQALVSCRTALTYGKTGEWYPFLIREEHKRLFFSRLAMITGTKRITALTVEELLNWRPLRTVPLPGHSGQGVRIHGYNLAPLETAVLAYTVGKRTVGDIISRLRAEFGSPQGEAEFAAAVIAILQQFDRRCWVTFSRF
ncbi:B12-binding domain-containing radical SAM protein [Sporomusa malonica]|uniref:Radical SAM superfamily enzyme YgiQ, UPF0313 family n=1 Tax=Sporomusa malonica TaxID=112901 RepID=A0A1W2CW86_9FIRM|nr:radical SAM protein [Sporomusa malonica]SMC89480.1 Radical SAM superfamily enzyme YgiQ, UPF0313 family [Sporomusa malonica]